MSYTPKSGVISMRRPSSTSRSRSSESMAGTASQSRSARKLEAISLMISGLQADVARFDSCTHQFRSLGPADSGVRSRLSLIIDDIGRMPLEATGPSAPNGSSVVLFEDRSQLHDVAADRGGCAPHPWVDPSPAPLDRCRRARVRAGCSYNKALSSERCSRRPARGRRAREVSRDNEVTNLRKHNQL